ncbi:hypothetical protein GGI07_000295 [Coemansia sp. Benny D115]|nr:hypothetical protein GGI07_000295 [Coemansia sp. Benny D115]
MGLCCSKPRVDEDENENTALLREEANETVVSPVFDRFANMSPEEIARFKEEERLKTIESQTTDALINISHRSDYAHGQPSVFHNQSSSRDYADVLNRFNQTVKLPLATLSGPVEEPYRNGGGNDMAAILTNVHVYPEDIRLIDQTIAAVLEAISDVRIELPGECVVPLSISNE